MSIAIDANVLIYRTNANSANHLRAIDALDGLFASEELVYLFWPVLVAYVRVTTMPGVLRPPLGLRAAMENVSMLIAMPRVRVGAEGMRFWDNLESIAVSGRASGRIIYDAHIVALMRQHDVGTIWTHDRDFRRFDGIRVVDPFE